MEKMKEELIFEKISEFLEKAEVYNDLSNKNKNWDLSLSEIHCIDNIEKLEAPNVTLLSNTMRMTRGGITKITRKLIKKEFITSFKEEGNKKEVYFKLTSKGMEVYLDHKKSHETAKHREMNFYSAFTGEEQSTILKFLERSNDHLQKEMHKLKEIKK
ncbi:MarR family transcriptional regulator [Fusobacteria bacterium ZRK30]|nr:MarR family transcriptional regulator [Fusobacteria bacterium ZRK30]